MKTSKLFFVFFALLCVTVLFSCQKTEWDTPPEEVVQVSDSVWILTIQATKTDTKSADTKAFWVDNSGSNDVLKFYWKSTEKVKVYSGETCIGTLNVTPTDTENPEHPKTATLSGTVNATNVAVGDNLLLMLPTDNWDYSKQNGTLSGSGSIEETCGLAVTTISITGKDETTHTITASGSVNFTNEQSIYRFAFKLSGSDLSVKDFVLSAASNKVVQSRTLQSGAWTSNFGSIKVALTNATSELVYVALRNETEAEDTYAFIITGGDNALYAATKVIPVSVLGAQGKFITARSVAATKPSFGASSAINDIAEIY